MAKIKYDVRGVESSRDFADLKPGLYPGEIIECTQRESRSGNDMIEVVLKLGGDAKGAQLWYYIVLSDEALKFRVRELTDAVGLPEKGTIDTDKIVGKKVNVRTRMGKDENDQPKPEVQRLSALKGEDEDEDEDGDGDDAAYEDMDLDALKEALEEREIEVEGKVTKKKAIAALEADDEESDDDDEEEEEEDDDEVDLDELSRKQLRAYIEENDLDVKVKKAMSDDDIRVAIAEASDDEEDDDDEDEDEDEEPDYSALSMTALKEELEKRGLKSNGKKVQLVARLEKDDESDDGDPF